MRKAFGSECARHRMPYRFIGTAQKLPHQQRPAMAFHLYRSIYVLPISTEQPIYLYLMKSLRFLSVERLTKRKPRGRQTPGQHDNSREKAARRMRRAAFFLGR